MRIDKNKKPLITKTSKSQEIQKDKKEKSLFQRQLDQLMKQNKSSK